MRKILWAAGCLLLVGAVPALAGQAELGIYGGYGWPGKYGGLDPKNRGIYGARLGYFFTQSLSLEGSAQRLPSHSEFDPSTDVKLDGFRGNLLYTFMPAKRLRPFLTAGAGAERTTVTGVKNHTDFGWNAGGGLRLAVARQLDIRGDGRYVRVNAEDLGGHQNNAEATLGLSYIFGGAGAAAAVSAAPPSAPEPTVSCASAENDVQPGQSVTLHATAADPPSSPLTYNWSTSAGTVTGNGPDATLDLSGVTAPTTATVTVRVTDQQGRTASSNCDVRLAAATPAAQPVSCLASGFPRNLSRLNNVDKACLDDVVQRLNADPRATVTVTGAADPAETSPDQIAQQRADAVKAYLVQAGVDASRITTRSIGATQPLPQATGMPPSNRRVVQVWFVPQGATVPG